MKKRFYLLVIITSVIILFLIYFLNTQKKIFYIPDIKMYIKTETKPCLKYGYIYFSKDSIFATGKMDYIKALKLESFNAGLYVSNIYDSIFLYKGATTLEINEQNYKITELEKVYDTISFNDYKSSKHRFMKLHNVNGEDKFIVEILTEADKIYHDKNKYTYILIDNYFSNLYFSNYEKKMHKVKDINIR